MKKTLLTLFLFPGLFLYGQGIVNSSAYIVFDGNAHVAVNGGSNGNYTSSGLGVIKNNSGSGVLHIEGDWVNNSSNVGFSNDGLTVELNGANQNIKGTTNSTFYNLTLEGTGTKTLDRNTTVGGISNKTGVLALKNLPLKLNAHTLIISNPNTTAITRTSGVVISEDVVSTGNVPNPAGGNASTATNPSIITWESATSTGTYTFPFGVSTNANDYVPIRVNKTSANASNINASTRSTVGNNNQPWTTGVTNMWSDELTLQDASKETAIDRWYEVVPSGSMTGDLTLTYRGVENTTDYPGGTFAIQLWDPAAGYPHDGSASAWGTQEGSGPGVTTGTAQVTAGAINAFGTFVITSATSAYGPLPVEFTSFTATCQDAGSLLTWTTASEHNSDYFVLEGSRNGINWSELTTIPAAGNSSTENVYSYIDPSFGLMYYRVKQVDMDGKSVTYGPISSNCGGAEGSLVVFPNPTDGSFTVEINHINDKENVSLQLLDMQGRLIQDRKVTLNNGVNQYMFDIQNLAKATYTLRIVSETDYKAVKVVRN